MNAIELIVDIVFIVEIGLNFLKRTLANKDIATIAINYLTGYFIFDVLATLPGLITQESLEFIWFKAFRLVHFFRITDPLTFLLGLALTSYSKKRQNDFLVFAKLILIVIYISHLMACIWLSLGMQ